MKVEDQLPNEKNSSSAVYSFPSILCLWSFSYSFSLPFLVSVFRYSSSGHSIVFFFGVLVSLNIGILSLWLTSVFCSFKQLTGRIPVHSLFVCNNSLNFWFLCCPSNWFEREKERWEVVGAIRMWIFCHIFIFVRVFNGRFVYSILLFVCLIHRII